MWGGGHHSGRHDASAGEGAGHGTRQEAARKRTELDIEMGDRMLTSQNRFLSILSDDGSSKLLVNKPSSIKSATDDLSCCHAAIGQMAIL